MSLKNRSLLRGTNANARPENHDLKMTDKLAKKLGGGKIIGLGYGCRGPLKAEFCCAAPESEHALRCLSDSLSQLCRQFFLIVHIFICHDPRPRKAATESAAASHTFYIFL